MPTDSSTPIAKVSSDTLSWVKTFTTLGALLLLSITPPGNEPGNPIMEEVFNAGHFFLYIIVTGIFFFNLPRSITKQTSRLLAVFLLCTLLGALIEIVQPEFGRSSSWSDLVNNIVGSLVFICGVLVWNKSSAILRSAHAVVSTLIGLYVLLPAVKQYQAATWMNDHFPVLADFESEIQLMRWSPINENHPPVELIELAPNLFSSPGYALEIRTPAGSWRGVSFYLKRSDWSKHKKLSLEIFNPDAPFNLRLRIDDDLDCSVYANRYNRQVHVPSGLTNIAIPIVELKNGPKTRELNVHAISKIYLFFGNNEPPHHFLLDNLLLE